MNIVRGLSLILVVVLSTPLYANENQSAFWLACNRRDIVDLTSDGDLKGAEYEYIAYAETLNEDNADLLESLQVSEELKDAARFYRVNFRWAPNDCKQPSSPNGFDFNCKHGPTDLKFEISPTDISLDYFANVMGWPKVFPADEQPVWKYKKNLKVDFVEISGQPKTGKSAVNRYEVAVKFGREAKTWVLSNRIGNHCYSHLCERNGKKRPVQLKNQEAIDCSGGG